MFEKLDQFHLSKSFFLFDGVTKGSLGLSSRIVCTTFYCNTTVLVKVLNYYYCDDPYKKMLIL